MTIAVSKPPERTAYDRARARIPGFCRRHYSFLGSLRLHRAALGWDLLRAPINVGLALLLLVLRLAGGGLFLIRQPRLARWVLSRRVLLATNLGRRVEMLIRTELLRDPEAGGADLLADYAGTRTAAADMTASIGSLSAGAILYKTVTPGVISLTPFVALSFAQSAAIAAFPLGGLMGSAWYWMFPAEAPLWMMVLFGLGLATAVSVLTTFAGIVADPVQRLLGVHQRRLSRLIDRIEADQTGQSRPFGTGEHLLARLGDGIDFALSLVRHLRP